MGTPTYIPIATLTLTGTDTRIDFQNIPNAYRDLVLVINGSVNVNSNLVFYYNNDSEFGTSAWMNGPGTGGGSSSLIDFMFAGTWNANLPSSAIIEIMDYSSTDKGKNALVRSDQPGGTGVWSIANRWRTTTAVNRITIDPTSTNAFNAGSTFNLFGIVG